MYPAKANPATRNIPVILLRPIPTRPRKRTASRWARWISSPSPLPLPSCRRGAHALTLKFQSDLLRNLAFLDGLTGVFNRRYFDQQLGVEWARIAPGNAFVAHHA